MATPKAPSKNQIKVSVGKVPAKVVEIMVAEGLTVEQVMTIGAKECGFSFTTKEYKSGSNVMLDVPFLNGTELCKREGKVITKVFWDTKVSHGDIVLIIPKIKGNATA